MRTAPATMMICATMLGVSWPADGFTEQPAKVELTEEQLDLNNRAIRALQQEPPDLERARKFADAAWLLGEPNQLVALTIGRIHHVARRCREAETAYEETRSMPGVVGLTDDTLAERREQYVGELSHCFGRVAISCESSAETTVEIAGIPTARCGSSHRVDPGRFTVTIASPGWEATVREIAVEAGSVEVVEVLAPPKDHGPTFERARSGVLDALTLAARTSATFGSWERDTAESDDFRPPPTAQVYESRRPHDRPPRRDSRFAFSALLGTGRGTVPANSLSTVYGAPTLEPSTARSGGFARMNVGVGIGARTVLGVAVRYQFAPTLDLDSVIDDSTVTGGEGPATRAPCFGSGLPGECLVGLRYHLRSTDRDDRPYAALDVQTGAGRLRHEVEVRSANLERDCGDQDLETDGDQIYCTLEDTVRNGGYYFSTGLRIGIPLIDGIDVVADLLVILNGPDGPSIHADLSGGLLFHL